MAKEEWKSIRGMIVKLKDGESEVKTPEIDKWVDEQLNNLKDKEE